ncbi:MAG: hypothetical protein HY758_03330, partial [Nitrospirae bacterium]|nr:hypothetical protein [Nitrospirota bacterium]
MFKIDIIYPFGNFGITMSGIFLSYAIFRNHLMDINIALKRSLIYSLTVSIVTGLYVVFVIMVTKLLSDVSGISSLAITTLAALIMALLFHPLRDRVQSLIDRLFSKTTYDYYSTVNKVSYELASTIDLKYIQRYIVDTMFSLLKVKTAYLLSEKDGYFVPAYYRCHKNTPDNDMSKKRISKGSELINFMNSKKILIKEELQMLHDYPAAVIEDLILFESEVAVPVFIEDKIAFLFILGEKLSGDMLSEEDIRLLTTIANQASTALKNALLYEELEVRVEKRTAEITAVVDQLQEEIIEKMHAEVELKRFSKKLEQKNQELQEFAYIASHDLQEPLRKVMAFGDRLKTKYAPVMDDQGRDYLERMQNATRRMQNFINDLLTFSRITTRAHPFISTDLSRVAHEVLVDLEGEQDEERE